MKRAEIEQLEIEAVLEAILARHGYDFRPTGPAKLNGAEQAKFDPERV